MLSSRWVCIIVDSKIQLLCFNVFPALFLRVQLRPASSSDRRNVLADALYTSLQGFHHLELLTENGAKSKMAQSY